jgi:hypothetical protein
MKSDFDIVSSKMMELLGVKSLAKLARALDITPQSLNKHKKKGLIPPKHILSFSKKYGVLVEDLLDETGGKTNLKESKSLINKGLSQNRIYDESGTRHNPKSKKLSGEDYMSRSQKDELIRYKDLEIQQLKARLAKYEDIEGKEGQIKKDSSKKAG